MNIKLIKIIENERKGLISDLWSLFEGENFIISRFNDTIHLPRDLTQTQKNFYEVNFIPFHQYSGDNLKLQQLDDGVFPYEIINNFLNPINNGNIEFSNSTLQITERDFFTWEFKIRDSLNYKLQIAPFNCTKYDLRLFGTGIPNSKLEVMFGNN